MQTGRLVEIVRLGAGFIRTDCTARSGLVSSHEAIIQPCISTASRSRAKSSELVRTIGEVGRSLWLYTLRAVLLTAYPSQDVRLTAKLTLFAMCTY